MKVTAYEAALSRRTLLRRALIGGAALGVSACTVTQNGTVTTVTLDGARILADGQAILSALQAALAIPGVAALLGANTAVAEAALTAAAAALTELNGLLGTGTLSVSVDTARVQSLVSNLLGDAQTVLSLLQTRSVGTATATQLQLLIAAATTLMPLVRRAAGLAAAAAPRAAVAMSEADALRIARGA